MEKRVLMLVVVVALGVALGVGIVSKQAKDPALGELLKQQALMIDAQQRMEKKLNQASGTPSAIDGGLSAQLLQKYQALEQRIASLESQLTALRAAGPAAQPQVPPAPPQEDFTTVYKIPVTHTPIIGQKNAPVTIVAFTDFQCPFCSRFHEPLLEAIKANPSKANYMIKNYPLSFHPQAKPAAKAALAAGEQGKYAEMAEAILADNKNLSEDLFGKIAKDIGLNVEKFWKDYRDKDAQWEKYIQDDIDLGNEVGVRGTPTFYINGHKTPARDLASWNAEIEKALKEKK